MSQRRPTWRGESYCVAGAPNEQSCKNTIGTFTPGTFVSEE